MKKEIIDSFSSDFPKFLIETGFNKYCKSEKDLDTRLYHDLGMDEDIAEDILDLLKDKYNVEVSQFKLKSYFPPEFQGKNQFERVIFWIFPFLENIFLDKEKYIPFTFRMIEEAISCGKLANKKIKGVGDT